MPARYVVHSPRRFSVTPPACRLFSYHARHRRDLLSPLAGLTGLRPDSPEHPPQAGRITLLSPCSHPDRCVWTLQQGTLAVASPRHPSVKLSISRRANCSPRVALPPSPPPRLPSWDYHPRTIPKACQLPCSPVCSRVFFRIYPLSHPSNRPVHASQPSRPFVSHHSPLRRHLAHSPLRRAPCHASTKHPIEG